MRTLIISSLAILTLFAGCSSGNKNAESAQKNAQTPPPPAAKPASQLETGRIAFQRMYVAARAWAADAQPVHLQSEPTQADDGADGKAGVWNATFASPAHSSVQDFTWSGVDEEDAPARGVTRGGAGTYSPSNVSTQPFDFAYLKIDSDKAYAAAKAKLKNKKEAATPVQYTLSFDGRKSQLVWAVQFGASGATTTIDVDATSGLYIRTER